MSDEDKVPAPLLFQMQNAAIDLAKQLGEAEAALERAEAEHDRLHAAADRLAEACDVTYHNSMNHHDCAICSALAAYREATKP